PKNDNFYVELASLFLAPIFPFFCKPISPTDLNLFLGFISESTDISGFSFLFYLSFCLICLSKEFSF
ncbi:MAG: hypothetical protein ACKO96_00960, partial [Flammeovirgaceae bacterium]